ncbi:MAG: hypothetical protein A3I05_10140 [Deltaproteobacteria bacterium RIFCSPLOWO2_02_FULL_44_10]|nr:MAG: hypothetical protein A3C46_08845 [Deltaproteobacteria bacterium RIFCSPHIGHO2_02_FULL_44_16]OGQ45903.1 MAG: hypothetical protein A3I05_10140 [Deltaproteobacteria bacterium RIFCSPLOWO2_02_FULL_44_10]
MRFFLLYLFYGIVALALQGTFFASFPYPSVRFDFMLMAIITLAFTEPTKYALPIVILLGALTDAVSVAPFGMSILSYSALYAAMRAIISQISFHAGIGRFFWAALMSFGDKCISGFLLLLWTHKVSVFTAWLAGALPQALCDALLALFFIPFLKWYGKLSLEKLRRSRALVMK